MNNTKIIEDIVNFKSLCFARFSTEQQGDGEPNEVQSIEPLVDSIMSSRASCDAVSYSRTPACSIDAINYVHQQQEIARRYANANGLNLLKTIPYDGNWTLNKGHGRIRRLLREIKDRKIGPGGVLLLESIDRLSPRTELNFGDTMARILEEAVKLVALPDGRKCNSGVGSELSVRFSTLYSLMAGHHESRTRSLRMKAVWAQKRQQAAAVNAREFTRR